MNSSTCCICFEEWKPIHITEYTEDELVNFKCGTCNDGKICNECFEKNSKVGQFCAFEYLIRETATEKAEHFKRTGWTKQMVKGMECVICKTPNWKQYNSQVIKRTLSNNYALVKQNCLWRANRGKKIKPCFWVFLKNSKEFELEEYEDDEEDTYYEQVIEAYEEYYKDKHEDEFGRTLRRIRKLKHTKTIKEKFITIMLINFKLLAKRTKQKYKFEKWKNKEHTKLIKFLNTMNTNLMKKIKPQQ